MTEPNDVGAEDLEANATIFGGNLENVDDPTLYIGSRGTLENPDLSAFIRDPKICECSPYIGSHKERHPSPSDLARRRLKHSRGLRLIVIQYFYRQEHSLALKLSDVESLGSKSRFWCSAA